MTKKLSSFRQNPLTNSIGSNVCQNINFLKILARTRSIRRQKKLLRLASTNELLSIVEVALNIIKGRFNLTTRQKNRLVPFADFVRSLSRVKSEKGARKILQRGSGIPIAALITPVILEALRLLSNKISQ